MVARDGSCGSSRIFNKAFYIKEKTMFHNVIFWFLVFSLSCRFIVIWFEHPRTENTTIGESIGNFMINGVIFIAYWELMNGR